MAWVLVTGASRGLGKEFARLFAKDGFNLFLTSRDEAALEELKIELEKYGVRVEYYPCDLTNEKNNYLLYKEVISRAITIDVLVNNAGFGDFGKFVDGDLNKYKQMIDLNVSSLMILSFLFGKDMVEQRFGRIINVASIAGFIPGPYMSVYYATKAFVLNFSLALNEEFKKDGVKVTCLCPGPIISDFWASANVTLSKFKQKFLTRSPKQVAKTGALGMDCDRALVIDGLLNKLGVITIELLPKTMQARVIALIQNKLMEKR